MPKEDIKKLLDESKKTLEKEHDKSVKQIKDELNSTKKKTLDKI